MKKCTKCKTEKPASDYNKNASRRDGLQTMCRECSNSRSRKYYEENKQYHLAQVYKNRKIHHEKARDYLWSILSSSPCMDCGESDPRVLDFDHLQDKSHNVSEMPGAGYSIKSIAEEVAKCEVVCSNCHRIRTYERSNSWRQKRFAE